MSKNMGFFTQKGLKAPFKIDTFPGVPEKREISWGIVYNKWKIPREPKSPWGCEKYTPTRDMS